MATNVLKTLSESLKTVKKQFENMLIKRNISHEEIVIYEYDKPQYNITSNEFFKYCENGIKIENIL